MKSIIPNTFGLARSGAIIAATLGFAVVSALAVPTVVLKVGGKNGEFGPGLDLKVSSGKWVLDASKAYTYELEGTCTGTGALAGAFPAKTPISAFLAFLEPGNPTPVEGIYNNPKGKLGFTVIDETFTGTKTIKNLGKVTLSAKVVAGTRTNGEVYLEVTEVKFSSSKPTPLGTVKFDKGAKFTVNAAPQIQFKAKGQLPFLENVGTAQISVTRFGNTKGATTINYTTVDGTAVSGVDYTLTAGTLTFAEGDSEEFIIVPIIDNTVDQSNRSFKIVLSSPQAGSVIGKNPENTVFINDND